MSTDEGRGHQHRWPERRSPVTVCRCGLQWNQRPNPDDPSMVEHVRVESSRPAGEGS